HRWPKGLAVAVAEVGLIAVVGGLVYLVVSQIRSGFPAVQSQAILAWGEFKEFLLESPLHVSEEQLNEFAGELWQAAQQDSGVLVSGVLSVGSTAGHLLAGVLLVLFITLF